MLGKISVISAIAMLTVACGSDDSSSGGTGGTSSGGTGAVDGGGTGGMAGAGGGSGGTAGMAGAGGGAGMAKLRIAHLAPDAPAVDVCVDGGAGFIGPVLKSAGNAQGLAYSEVTDYLSVPAGTYTARIVAPNADDCNTALGGLPDVTGLALAADKAYTAAATGMHTPPAGTKPFAVEAYEDTITAADAAKVYVRFVHASADTPAVDVGLGSGNAFTPIWTNVEFPSVGQVGGGDYLETDPINGATISARASGTTTDALVIDNVTVPAGAVVTAFAIGNLAGSPAPLKALICVDSAATSSCSVLP